MSKSIRHQNISISHPLIADAFIKTRSGGSLADAVLVIETIISNQENDEFDEEVFDLLTDLESFKSHAYEQFGFIKRIDIRTH
ncbi:MAG: hypothetical protein JKY71_03825 [Alphaproteobacteria bacterium]|nr:hypothetical protein [Alphaproteobacteria bacterium]